MQTRRGNTAPTVEIVTPERKKQLESSENALRVANTKLNTRRKQSQKPFSDWFEQCSVELKTSRSFFDPAGLVASFHLIDWIWKITNDIGVTEATQQLCMIT